MERPKKWSSNKNIYVTEKKYDMNKLHKFIKRCLKGTSADIKKVLIRKKLVDEGYLGLALFEHKAIMIDHQNGNQIMILLTILHEIFHYYFRDCDDTRTNVEYKTIREYENDVVEQRAEKSAVNMLKWYLDHLGQLEEIVNLINKTPVKKLTNSEKDGI